MLDFNIKSGFIEVPREHGNPGASMLKLYYELYERRGSRNKPLIALHGGPGAAMPFSKIVARSPLGEALLPHHRILYFDQRGAGKSSIGLTAELLRTSLRQVALSQYVEDTEVLRKAVFPGHPKVTILGASWGGYLGLAYAAKYRNRTYQGRWHLLGHHHVAVRHRSLKRRCFMPQVAWPGVCQRTRSQALLSFIRSSGLVGGYVK